MESNDGNSQTASELAAAALLDSLAPQRDSHGLEASTAATEGVNIGTLESLRFAQPDGAAMLRNSQPFLRGQPWAEPTPSSRRMTSSSSRGAGMKRQLEESEGDMDGDGDDAGLSSLVPTPSGEVKKQKANYFEFAKKRWESDDAFKLPDGSFWPDVVEGVQGVDHGIVHCRLCARHRKANAFATEGYRKGKRSALVDHQTKNKEHKQLVQDMEMGLKKVMLVAGLPQRLVGKVALVTGGAKGIGFACASCLGHEGAKVVIADIDEAGAQRAVTLLQLDGLLVSAVRCDVSVKADVLAAVEHTVAAFGGLDILVANAGIVKGAEFLDMAEEDFDAVVNVNLKGVFLCGQAAAAQMVEQNKRQPGRGGAIINMSSVNAVMAIATVAGYNAAKGGVNNLTRCMALALAPHHVRVNAVGPGSIMTEVLSGIAGDKSAMNRVLSRTPMQRIGDPLEIGQIVTFLASDAASYVTGQILYADGGRMALNYTVPVPSTMD